MNCSRCGGMAQTTVNVRHFKTFDVCVLCAKALLTDRQTDHIPQPAQPAGLIEEANIYRAQHAVYMKKRGWENDPVTTPLMVIGPDKPLHAFFSLKRFHEVGQTPQGGSSYVNVCRGSQGVEVLANLVSETLDHGQPFDDVEYRGLVVEFVRQIGYHRFLQMIAG